MASEEEIISLFDSYWFEHGIFSAKPLFSTPKPNPALEINQIPNLSSIPTINLRSLSDHCLSSSELFSPKSVLRTPKLQPILSGKEVGEFSEPISKQEEIGASIKKRGGKINRRRRKQGTIITSKSLSELEFEELKGFMDLGFVFSEEDKINSSLVSIIPGLQRLGRKSDGGFDEEHGEEDEVKEVAECDVRRPYLSEAWNPVVNINQRNNMVEINPPLDLRIPSLGNEMEIKDHLRIWAHTVASTVR